jgi:uncharacterized membrane protein required for colicin V production
MTGLNAIFWMFVILFGLIGAMRGWPKELLVTFATILSLFILNVLETYVPFVSQSLRSNPETLFWLRMILLVGLVFFGYQSPNLQRLASSNRFAREKLQDYLLGFVLGAINAYLFVGSIWWFMDQAGYPLKFIIPPDPNTEIGQASLDLLKRMPPTWLTAPTIYFAIALAFAFVIVVFI